MHKFEWVNPYGELEPRKVTIEVGQDADLTEMLEAFEGYLKAVGYYVDGCVDIVPEHSSDETVRNSIDDATPEEWNRAYKNVKVTYK